MQHTTSMPKPPQDAPDPTDEPFCLLLDLPPEIRTMIWDYALTSPTAIKITDKLKSPALVQVNRQIRSETRKLALTNNRYQIEIVACDARLFAKFFQHWHRVVNSDWAAAALSSNEKKKIEKKKEKKLSLPIRIGLVGDCHWGNLVRWCRLVSRGKCGSLRVGAAGRGRSLIVEAATGLAANAGSWGEVERGLEFWRPVAGLDDGRWLLDL